MKVKLIKCKKSPALLVAEQVKEISKDIKYVSISLKGRISYLLKMICS